MYCTPFVLILALATLSLATENRKFHRLRGNRLRISDPDPDDAELIQIEATGSDKQKDKKSEKNNEMEKVKTLSQQVADGKYGLIQKELFSKPPKRPGILSYDDNPEVPKDNINNLGGLDKSEIWLAENHLLVLKGGIYPPHDDKNDHPENIWPPIDDFKAPLHQVKIPSHPKVPPPFPVQLTEDGPLQILGTNFSRPFNETDQPPLYALPPPEGFPQGPFFPPFYPNSTDFAPGQTPLPIPVKPSGEYEGGVPVPPPNLNQTWPPFFGYLPPGAVILPPPENQTEYDDEDPSIYYPPPYSFFYPKDNSSAVPAGPLVPGIVLPPPPNFFALLDETPKPGITNTRKQQKQRKPIPTKTYSPIYTTTTHLPPTTKTKLYNTEKPIKIYPIKDQILNNEIPSKITTESPKVVTILPLKQGRTYLPPQTSKPFTQLQRKKPENITILRPVPIIATPSPQVNVLNNEIPNKPFGQYGPPIVNKKVPVSTTQVPLKYYTSNSIETSSQNPIKYESTSKAKEAKTTKSAQYYYYEEPETSLPKTPKVPIQSNTFIETTESYFKTPKPTPIRTRRPQYIYVTARPYNTQKPRFRFIQQPVKTDSYSIHIAKLQNHIHQFYTTQRPITRPSPKPVYQYSFQAANYQTKDDFKPSPPDTSQLDNFKPIPNKYNEDIRPDLQKPPVPMNQNDFIRPKYTVEIQQAIEIIPTRSPQYEDNPIFFQQTYRKTTPRPENYYTSLRPSYQFEDVTQKPQFLQSVTTSKPISQYSFGVTSNPVYQGFYTKPDEGFFDENTREYFTVFGRKLPGGTTPLPGYDIPDAFTSQNEQHSQYQEQKPISLETDTVVNYVDPKPAVNPDAELVPLKNSKGPPNYPNVVRYTTRPQNKQRERGPEIVKAIPVDIPSKQTEDGSYISYQLPGDDGAHFYFITPQLATRRDQGAGFYYEQTNARRIRRNQNKSDKGS